MPLHQEASKAFTPCEPGATVTFRFEQPVERGVLLVSTNAQAGGAQVHAPEGSEARVEGRSSLWLLHLSGGATPLSELTLRTSPEQRPEGCWYRGAALLRLAPEGGSPPEAAGP